MNNSYKIAAGKRIYAIGDIHGYPDILVRMHEKIETDFKERPIDEAIIIYMGDYIDRGPDSKGVVDILLDRELYAPEFKHVFLMGNHEDAMFNEFMNDPNGSRSDWLEWGGVETAESYGVEIDKSKAYAPEAKRIAADLKEALPLNHQEFYKNLQLHHRVDDYLFVHAGIKPNVPLEKQTKQDLTFTREPFMSYEGDHGVMVVHGHTPPKNRKIDIRHNRINVDTGLYMGGPLTCAVIEGGDLKVIEVKA